MRSLIISLAILALFTSASAQIKHDKRIEFELSEGYVGHKLANFGDNGMLLYARSTSYDNGMAIWKLERYDTALVKTSTNYIKVPKKLPLDEVHTTDRGLHLFFKNKRGLYDIHSVNAATMQITHVSGAVPAKTYIYDLKVLGNTAYFDATVKGAAVLYTIDLKSGVQRPIPITIKGYRPTRLSIERIQVQQATSEVFVYVNAHMRKKHDLYVLRYDEEGLKLGTFHLSEGIEQHLSSVAATHLKGNDFIYAGTYSSFSSAYSQGLYISHVRDEQQQFIRFYNFLDFDKFLSYLPDKRVDKIERKKERREKMGKDFNLNYLIAAHDVIEADGKYIFIGEAYYPTYKTEIEYTYDINGNPITRTKRVFDGYQYTHAVVAAFDQQGIKLWDNTFHMYPGYKPFGVKRFITSTVENGHIDLMFASMDALKSKSFDFEGMVVSDKSWDFIETLNEADRIKYSFSNVRHWYDNYFVAHGLQRIKNEDAKFGDRKRSVFFINKISYQ